MSSERPRIEWNDGSFNWQLEIPITVNYQDKGGRLYFQVYHKSDFRGECDIASFLDKEQARLIEDEIIAEIEKKGEY